VKRFDKTLHPSGAVKRARRLRGSMTLPEKVLWKALRKMDLHVRRQAPIGRYVADFAIHDAGLVIEVDGGWHDLADAQLRDVERDAWLESQGYKILRFRNQQVSDDLEAVVDAILKSLPPRWGKGRDGGASAAVSNFTHEAATPSALDFQPIARTPTQPSPIEGEGFSALTLTQPSPLEREGALHPDPFGGR
jgi:very-short-patch-repair endonuclease